MKPTFATALSVAGVMAAGAAAFAVNSSVLGGSVAKDSAAAAPADTSALQPSGGVSAQDESLLVTDTTAVPNPTPISDTTTAYKVGDAGSVVVSTASGRIEIASISPAAGWAAEPAMTQPDGSVKVHFYSATTRLEFVASMVDGKVSVSVSADNRPTGPANPGSRADDDDDSDNNPSRRGDDDHESREDSEHEDDDD